MEQEFSKFLKDKHDYLKEIVTKLLTKYEYVSILASDCKGQKYMVSNKEINANDSSWLERGFVIRVFNNGLYSEYSSNNFNDADAVVASVIESVNINEELQKSIYAKHNKVNLYSEEKIVKNFSRIKKYEHVTLEEFAKESKKLIEKIMEENEYIIFARCGGEYMIISKTFISNNKDMSQVYTWANTNFMCITNRDDKTNSSYASCSDVSFKKAFDKIKKQYIKVANDATDLLDSTRVEPGEYECITTPEITGLIAHEAFGHGVEMDMFVKNRALGASYINKRVGSDLVTMHEGAIPYEEVSSYFFDDEGTLAHDTIEIKKGILKTGVADAIAACHLNIKPTGNGKRESYKRKAYSRMTSTYFEKGKDKLEDMIKSIKYGFLIDVEESGMEDPKNWGIQCIASIGREIKDGKLTGKVVSPLVITGYVPDLLNSISMVSDDFELYGGGACGKGYKEWVKTAIGGPYLKAKVKLG